MNLEDASSGVVSGLSDMRSEFAEAPLDAEEQLLVTTRLHQVLRPFMLRRLKESVVKELPVKVGQGSRISGACVGLEQP